jgi:hypothetical protein
MTQGQCIFGCKEWQANLEGHYSSFHHLNMPQQTPIASVTPEAFPDAISAPQSKRTDTVANSVSSAYCPTCGRKTGEQTWRESVVAWGRYALIAFWVGAFIGALSGFQIAAQYFHFTP